VQEQQRTVSQALRIEYLYNDWLKIPTPLLANKN
jgi:hypothetical protein